MTKEEFLASKHWETDIMTDEEKNARIDRIVSHFGTIDDPAFKRYPDAVISTDTSYPVDDSIDFDAVRERLLKMTDDPHMKRIIMSCGVVTDPTFKRHPEVPVSTYVEV